MLQTDFRWFYGLMQTVPINPEDREAFKRHLVSQFTKGRTTHLREMKQTEYRTMCEALDKGDKKRMMAYETLRRLRSTCLHAMQKAGINTASWAAVDNYCLNPRIMGKRFRDLSEEELEAVTVKTRVIMKKREELQREERRQAERRATV